MGTKQSVQSLSKIKKVSKMNQSIRGFVNLQTGKNGQQNDKTILQPSYIGLHMDNENIVELSYDLMAMIAMSKVNAFNESAYHPLMSFNPFEPSGDNGINQYPFHNEFTENVNKMFELQKDESLPFAINEEENEDLDLSSEDNKKENTQKNTIKEEDNKAKNHLEQTWVSNSMKKVINQKKSERNVIEQPSKYSDVVSYKSSDYQMNDNSKTAKKERDKDSLSQTIKKPTDTLSKSKTNLSDRNNNQGNESKNTDPPRNCIITETNQIEQSESSFENSLLGDKLLDEELMNFYLKNNKSIPFKIDIQKLIRDERLKKLSQLRKSGKNNRYDYEIKNTTFIEQIDKYMELDTSYNAKIDVIKSNKRIELIKFRQYNSQFKPKKIKKAKRNTAQITKIINLNDVTSNHMKSASSNFNISEQLKTKNHKISQSQSKQKQEINKNNTDDEEEFYSASSSPCISLSNHNQNTN